MFNRVDNQNLFNFHGRTKSLHENSDVLFDLIIIGGGITGAGICLDASSRGIKTLLIEKNDFASGTSSKSTKLIHGGLRYLKSLEFNLVRTVGQERTIAFKNAPHLIIPQKLILPIYQKGSFKKWQLRIALTVYDFLARVQKKEKKKILSSKTTLEKEPSLKSTNLLGAGMYSEYRTDDSRLTLELIKTSLRFGAFAFNYVEATDISKENNTFVVTAKNCIDNRFTTLRCKQLVNATGPWTDDLREINFRQSKKKICLSKGVHIVLKHNDLPLKNPVYFDALERRMCFAIPRNNCTYVGTTDTIYTQSIKENPRASKNDIQYIIDSVNNHFNVPTISENNIISSWTGLRPLIYQKNKKTKELSRKDELIVDANNMISIAGGKLTGYRIMAKKVTDLVCKNLRSNVKCKTHSIQLLSSKNINESNLKKVKNDYINELLKYGLLWGEAENLFHTYGSNLGDIIELKKLKKLKTFIEAEALYCLKKESTITLVDFFERRTSRIHYNPDKIFDQAKLILPIFSKYLKLSNHKEKHLLEELFLHQQNLTHFK